MPVASGAQTVKGEALEAPTAGVNPEKRVEKALFHNFFNFFSFFLIICYFSRFFDPYFQRVRKNGAFCAYIYEVF